MTEPRSVQGYIDQTPAWPDGTPTPTVPMTRMQWRIWLLATAGKFFEGLVVFMTGVALPLIVKEYDLSSLEKGLVGAAPLAGIMVGAIALGGLADTYGRRFMFVLEMLVFVVFLVGLAGSPGLRLAGLLPVRRRRGAGLRLSHRPPGDLREHPQPRPRPAGAGRLRLPGDRRTGRHGGGLRHPGQLARARRLALDVRHGDRAGRPGGDRPPVHHRQRPLADGARPHDATPSASCSGCWSASRTIPSRSTWPIPSIPTRRCTAPTRAAAAGAISSTGRTAAPPSWPRCRGSCRTSAPTASASSRR